MRLLLVDVEVVSAARAMVGADEVNDALRHMRLVRHFDAIGHMRDDDFSTFIVSKVIVRTIRSMLVLGEIHRVVDLTDVVIQGTRTGQHRIAANLEQHLFAEVGHLDGVLEGAWRRGRQLAQQRTVGVAQVHQ